MTIAYVAGPDGWQKGTLGTGTTPFKVPSSSSVSNFLVLVVSSRLKASSFTFSGKTDWMHIADVGNLHVYTSTVGAGQVGATGTVSSSNGSDDVATLTTAYSGASTAAVYGSTGSLTCPSETLAQQGIALRVVYAGSTTTGSSPNSVSWSPSISAIGNPSYENTGGTDHPYMFAAGYQTFASSGSVGAVTATMDVSEPDQVALTILITADNPPNTAAWSSPADGVTLDRTVDQVLTYVFSDPDAGDSQSARKWRYSTDGGATWTETDETTVSTSITITADTFANGATVQVQVMPADSLGTYAASWSASLHVTFEDPPSPPTIIAPTSGATIGSSTATVAFSAPSLTQYKYRVVGDNGSGGADTGTVYVAETTVINTSSRSFTVTGLPNSTTVHIQVDIENDGLWSGYADQANPVSYDPPPTPTLTITPGTSTLTVTVATAAPGTGEVAAESVTVENSTDGSTAGDWRRSGKPINGDVTYETPASGQPYWFRVTAYAASGVSAASVWTA